MSQSATIQEHQAFCFTSSACICSDEGVLKSWRRNTESQTQGRTVRLGICTGYVVIAGQGRGQDVHDISLPSCNIHSSPPPSDAISMCAEIDEQQVDPNANALHKSMTRNWYLGTACVAVGRPRRRDACNPAASSSPCQSAFELLRKPRARGVRGTRRCNFAKGPETGLTLEPAFCKP